ncbi:alpha-glucosidase/alpha-galactosidase, partial [Candidatus Poribacteria bacterium]|nr:alpha-glucosidase/alpha-galactosidase [Candidatus Poribacteria bacterium]
MSNEIKITVIGAGSAVFSMGLVKDLCLTENLAGSHVCFMDIDKERLDMIHKLATRYAGKLGANLSFKSTLDRKESLGGADFVINTASVVSHDESIARREIGEKHGYYYGRVNTGEYTYRNMRFMMDVVRDMEEVCPNAWLIQSGNPVKEGCTLMTRESNIKIIGLCHGHYGYRKICNVIGIDPNKVTWQAPGLNHNIWLTHFIYEGKNAYALLDEWIDSKAEAYWKSKEANLPSKSPKEMTNQELRQALGQAWDIDMSRGAIHMYKMFGLMPIGDTPRGVGWWYHKDIEAKHRWLGKPWGGQDSHLSWPLYVENLNRHINEMVNLANDQNVDLVKAIGMNKTSEQQVPIIDALVNNKEGQFQVNVPNNGIIAELPDNLVVEVPAIINQKGVQPYIAGSIPKKIMLYQIMPDWLQVERAILAFK